MKHKNNRKIKLRAMSDGTNRNASNRDACSVCGDQATKLRYSHYGATSCFSCRAFFRRAIEKNSFVTYVCRLSNKKVEEEDILHCVMNIAGRKKCAACRFRKCKLVGMKHAKAERIEIPENLDAVMSTEEIDKGDLSIVSQVESQLETRLDREEDSEANYFKSMLAIPSREVGLSSMCLTNEEAFKIDGLLSIDRHSRIALSDSLRQNNRIILKQFWTALFTGRALDFSATCWGYVSGIMKLTKFAQAIPEFIEVTGDRLDNKKCLLLHNLDPMFNVRSAFFFQGDATDFFCQLERFGIFDLTSMKSLIDIVLSSSLTSKLSPMQWNQYFVTPWANSIEHELKYEYLLSELHALCLDHKSACLLSVVALMNTYGLRQEQLSVPLNEIRRHEYNFSLLLFRYLVATRGRDEAARVFPGFMSTLQHLREMSEILKNKTIKIWPTPSVEQYVDMFIDSH